MKALLHGWAIGRSVTLAFAVGMLLLLALGSWTIASNLRSDAASRSAAQAHQINAAIADLMVALNEEESSQRGYLITGEERYLRLRSAVALRFAAGLDEFRARVLDNAPQLANAERLEALFAERLSWSQMTLDTYRKHGPDAAKQLIASGHGHDLLERVRAQLLVMQLAQGENLVGFTQAAQSAASQLAYLVPICSLLAAALFVAVVLLLNQEALQARRLQQQLRESEVQARAGERRYRELLRNLPVAAYTCARDGTVELYNHAAVALWGRTPQPGERWGGVHRVIDAHGQAMPRGEGAVGLVFKEATPQFGIEAQGERPDGTRYHIVANATPIWNEAGEVVGATNVLVDITARKRAEQALADQFTELRLRNEELDRFNRAVVDRELRMVELKLQVNGLRSRLGLTPQYAVQPGDAAEEVTAQACS